MGNVKFLFEQIKKCIIKETIYAFSYRLARCVVVAPSGNGFDLMIGDIILGHYDNRPMACDVGQSLILFITNYKLD